jgi:coenzyme PQQ precursor peptide PqqA
LKSSTGLLRGDEPSISLVRIQAYDAAKNRLRRKIMAWTTPTLVEICIGLEINGYLPAEF